MTMAESKDDWQGVTGVLKVRVGQDTITTTEILLHNLRAELAAVTAERDRLVKEVEHAMRTAGHARILLGNTEPPLRRVDECLRVIEKWELLPLPSAPGGTGAAGRGRDGGEDGDGDRDQIRPLRQLQQGGRGRRL
jgi:hypothetical protein